MPMTLSSYTVTVREYFVLQFVGRFELQLSREGRDPEYCTERPRES